MSILLFIFILILTYLIVTSISPKEEEMSRDRLISLQEELRGKQAQLVNLEANLNSQRAQLQDWQTTLSDKQQEIDKLNTQISMISKIEEWLLKARNMRALLLQAIQRDMFDIYGIEVKIDIEAGVLRLPEKILFDSGKAILKPQGKASLEALAKIFAKRLPCFSGRLEDVSPKECSYFSPGILDVILIEGHTDNIPISNYSFSDN
jgi:flagellar motor protein MotB